MSEEFGEVKEHISGLATNAQLVFYNQSMSFLGPALRAPGILNAASFAALLAIISHIDANENAYAAKLASALPILFSGMLCSAIGEIFIIITFSGLATAMFGINKYLSEDNFYVQMMTAKRKTERLAPLALISVVAFIASYILFFVSFFRMYRAIQNHLGIS